MPEIAESKFIYLFQRYPNFNGNIGGCLVARIVHFLKKNLVGKTIAKATAPDDAVVFGKAGTTGPEFEKAMTGKKVIDAGQQGKYFWYVLLFTFSCSRFVYCSQIRGGDILTKCC